MDHVEVLMRLYEADGTALAPMDIERDARLTPQIVERALADLVATGLARRDAAANAYLFAPGGAVERRAVEALGVMYHTRPVTLVKLIYSQPPAPVKSFADAFRLRDEPAPPPEEK